MPRDLSGSYDPAREQLSALRSMLVLSMLLTRQDDEDAILRLVANAVESLGPCRTERIMLDGQWTQVRRADHEPAAPVLADVRLPQEGVRFELAGVPWSWAYPMTIPRGPAGYLVAGADREPSDAERFLLHVLVQQGGVALANARLHVREREQAVRLRAANVALQRNIDIHDRLTRAALTGEGQEGIAQAVYQLTGHPAAIEDRFGNLRAWAGPGRPDRYPKDAPGRRDRLLRRAVTAVGPIRDGRRLFSAAVLDGAVMGVLVLHDPDGTAAEAERLAIEHATTVLTLELARLLAQAEAENRLRGDLVIELIEGADLGRVLDRAQALGYDFGRGHRVVLVEGSPDSGADALLPAVRRAAESTGAGSLLADWLGDVVVLADAEVPWDKFLSAVDAEVASGDCRMGVGSLRHRPAELPRSLREAQLALKIQNVVGGQRATLFDDLGVYQVLATAGNSDSVEQFVRSWLGTLLDYDAGHGTQLVPTLSAYLECGRNYDAAASALNVHRSTLRYRLQRIREVSGYDLGLADTRFNLQLAARAWRTTQILREP